MKKIAIILSIVLSVFSLASCNSNVKSEVATTPLETLDSQEIAMNSSEIEKPQPKIFSDFIYEVAPRFNVIKKTDLDKVRSFDDFIGEEHSRRIVSYSSVSVIILDGQEKTDRQETGDSGVLTPAQISLLQSSDYSTNILVSAYFQEKNPETGFVENQHWTPYLTIIPEVQASYAGGIDTLKKILKDQSEVARKGVDPEKLRPAKLFFTVTKNGMIENVKLDRTSGYPLVDKTMIELISTTQKDWKPAQNSKGEKVDQELVVSFGLLGC
tara:strand:- start:1125 stop:1931 length:807 start_codon:yes stop_codon:yes gene_type:complete